MKKYLIGVLIIFALPILVGAVSNCVKEGEQVSTGILPPGLNQERPQCCPGLVLTWQKDLRDAGVCSKETKSLVIRFWQQVKILQNKIKLVIWG